MKWFSLHHLIVTKTAKNKGWTLTWNAELPRKLLWQGGNHQLQLLCSHFSCLTIF